MKHLLTTLAAILVSLFTANVLQAAAKPGRPNIVFVLVDDLRTGTLGCEGHPFSKTPNIDRIGREGAIFRNAFVTTPLCSPSRGTFLTGQYAHRHGVKGNGGPAELTHKLVTFPRLLQESGYTTAYVGKWHMGNDDTPRPGFDRWVSFKGQGPYFDPMLNIDGQHKKEEGYTTDIINRHAADFVRQSHEKPFCLYVSHKAVHGPFIPAERHKDRYANASIGPLAGREDTLEGKPAVQQYRRPALAQRALAALEGPEAHDKRDELPRNQLRMLLSVDDGVGDLIRALEETRQLDNTMFIFTSDNGYFWSEHGLGDKRWAYEESIRIPMVVRYPKLIKAGTTLDAMTLNADIAPTLLELAGAKIPAEVQGRSFLPLFKKDNANWRGATLFEYFKEGNFPHPSWQAVRDPRWKYIHYTELEAMDELYDLKSDPHELKNLISESAAQKKLKQLKAELNRLTKSN